MFLRIKKFGSNLEVSDFNTIEKAKSIHTIQCPAGKADIKKIFVADNTKLKIEDKIKNLLQPDYLIANKEDEADTLLVVRENKDGRSIAKAYISGNSPTI